MRMRMSVVVNPLSSYRINECSTHTRSPSESLAQPGARSRTEKIRLLLAALAKECASNLAACQNGRQRMLLWHTDGHEKEKTPTHIESTRN